MSAHTITVNTDTLATTSSRYFWTCSCGLSSRDNFMATRYAETNGNHHAHPVNPWSRVGGVVRKAS